MNRTDPPKVLNVAAADRSIYEKVRGSDGPFKDKEWRDIFALCVALGFRQGARPPLSTEKHFLLRTESMLSDQVALVNAIAIAETGKLEILADQKEVWTIAEEYANAGIQALRDRFLGDTEGVFLKE